MFGRLRSVIDAVRGRPLTVDELAEELSLPKTTAYRYLHFLEGCGLVYKGEGKRYRWHELGLRREQKYSSRDEYEVLLNHSRELIPGIRAAIADFGGVRRGKLYLVRETLSEKRPPLDEEVLNKVGNLFLEHLRTGYPSVYGAVEKLKKLRFEQEEHSHTLRKTVAAEIVDALKIPIHNSQRHLLGQYEIEHKTFAAEGKHCYISSILEVSLEYARSRLRGRPLPEPKYDEGKRELACGAYTLAREISRIEADELIGDISSLEDVERGVDELMRLESEVYALQSKIGDELRRIEAEVRVGDPLEGSCGVCEQLGFPPPKPKPDASLRTLESP